MKQLTPDLWQTSRRQLLDGVYSHAYLLAQPQGNLLIYSLGEDQQDDLDAIEQLGGVAMQVLSHRDETGPALCQIRDRFSSRLAYHEADAHAISDVAEADLFLDPAGTDPLLEEIEVLHTPGHTPGSVSLRYESPHGKSYLFTGDTIVPNSGGWATGVYPEIEGDAPSLVESLTHLRDQAADLIISSAYGGESGVVEITPDEWRDAVDQRIISLRKRFDV
ncbi:MAG: MBL fold metallo-hydrolase [Chloroflexota bacterium]|nr:MBL fold metallo-hydrolase [Chloroflexota bacterium]